MAKKFYVVQAIIIQDLTSQTSTDVESSSYYLHSIQDGEEIVEI